jgi:hypothetical protein
LSLRRAKTDIFVILVACIISVPAVKTATLAEQPDLNVIVGEWARYDGDYTIRVQDVKPDGSVDVGYYNPGEIYVAESSVSAQKGLVKLFFKLQDKGYPGSTYTLYYYAENDALAGFYYQAALRQTFEVVFFRKPKR